MADATINIKTGRPWSGEDFMETDAQEAARLMREEKERLAAPKVRALAKDERPMMSDAEQDAYYSAPLAKARPPRRKAKAASVPKVQALAPKVQAVITLTDGHKVFARWLGSEYDTDALDAMLAAVAVERLDGDPIWLLVVSGSGNAKTETVQALDGIAAIITSTISSPGALLSATSSKERAKDATGGLLRKIGDRGVLVIKDVTSILSMNREMRAEVLGALREVYDGRWSRNVGTDGGRTLEWSGRVVVIGAVTTAWDRAHDVIASMGDRFVLLRMDSTKGRQAAGRQAIGNTGSEVRMRSDPDRTPGGSKGTPPP